jgi:Bacterial regulatory helix-turn-helix protein, lysR family
VGQGRGVRVRTTGDYAASVGTPRTLVPPPCGLGISTAITGGVLHRMIRTQDRSLGEAATALGTTLDTVRHILEIRPAPRPQPSSPEQARVHSSAYRAAKAVLPPTIIRPALVGKGGWERLQRFSAAIHYPTLDDAASNLGIHLAPLTSQVRRIERDLGATLLARAERGRPMQLTTYGARVVAAIKTCERRAAGPGAIEPFFGGVCITSALARDYPPRSECYGTQAPS